MGNVTMADVIPFLLSGGGLAFLVAMVQGWRDYRSGARQGHRETVADLMTVRDQLDDRLRAACDDRDFWRDLAAERGHQLRLAGVTPANPQPMSPSEEARRRTDRDRDGR